jgi:VanZ family protein
MGVIMLESTEMMSARNTGRFLYTVVTALFGPVDRSLLLYLDHLLRKTGHFLGYGVLCLLFFRALRATFVGTARRWALIAISFTFLVASLDEIHQSFLPSRTGRAQDVLLDTVGAGCLQLLLIALSRMRQKRLDTRKPEEVPEYVN